MNFDFGIHVAIFDLTWYSKSNIWFVQIGI
jgi:hypothetical protein